MKMGTFENNNLPSKIVDAPKRIEDGFERARIKIKEISKEYLESNQLLKDRFELLMNGVDIKSIQNIIVDYTSRAQVADKSLNFLEKDDFLILPKDNMYATSDAMCAQYLMGINTIVFNEKFVRDNQTTQVIFLKNTVHEIVHSLGHNAIRFEKSTRRGMPRGGDSASGYVFQKHGKDLMFEGFNEGVTERIAHEVTLEHIKRKGEFFQYKDELTGHINKFTLQKHFTRYGIYMFFVQSICEKIAAYSNLDTETIWRAVVRGYFAGDNLFQEKTKDLLDTSLGKHFVESLKVISNKTPMDKMGDFEKVFDLNEMDAFEEKWLTHLGLEKAR